MTNKAITKNLLEEKTCDSCVNGYFDPITWGKYIERCGAEPNEWCSFKSERPKENTCEEFKDDSGFYEDDIGLEGLEGLDEFDDADYDDEISPYDES